VTSITRPINSHRRRYRLMRAGRGAAVVNALIGPALRSGTSHAAPASRSTG
jgi:hypothetical protein